MLVHTICAPFSKTYTEASIVAASPTPTESSLLFAGFYIRDHINLASRSIPNSTLQCYFSSMRPKKCLKSGDRQREKQKKVLHLVSSFSCVFRPSATKSGWPYGVTSASSLSLSWRKPPTKTTTLHHNHPPPLADPPWHYTVTWSRNGW